LQNIRDQHADNPAKWNVWHSAAFICYFWWTAAVGNNSLSNMYAHAQYFLQCYRGNYTSIIKVLIWGPGQSAFYAYAHIIYVHSTCIRVTEHYRRIWTSVHICTCNGSR
jgi:hypothetical protein